MKKFIDWFYTPASEQPKDGFIVEAVIGAGGGSDARRIVDEQHANDIAGTLNELGQWAANGSRATDPAVQEELERLYRLLKRPSPHHGGGEFIFGSQRARK